MVIAAGPAGLCGLLLGRWLADKVGRRWSAGSAQAVVAMACLLTYSGTPPAAIAGYLISILAASAYAPSIGSQAAELFPTGVRGSVAGWLTAAGVVGAVAGLVVFGAVADQGGFRTAALVIGLPTMAGSLLFTLLPETRDAELEAAEEDSGPDA
jgi:MFS family permease